MRTGDERAQRTAEEFCHFMDTNSDADKINADQQGQQQALEGGTPSTRIAAATTRTTTTTTTTAHDHRQLLLHNYNHHRCQQPTTTAAEQHRHCTTSISMGKCISKHPSAITIALSTTDLATANHILSKFSDSADYISLKDEQGNPLFEYFGAGSTEVYYATRKDIGWPSEAEQDTNNNRNYRLQRQGVPVDCNSSSILGDTGCGLDNEGQTESKKSSKKAGVAETKGTAMSFGFRKKLHVTPKKSKNLQKQKELLENNPVQHSGGGGGVGDEKTKQKLKTDTVIADNTTVWENTKSATHHQNSDKNGNTETTTTTTALSSQGTAATTPVVTFEKVGPAKTHHQTVPSATQGVPVADNTGGRAIITTGTGAINRSNRFGFKGTNTVRPASTGITPRYQSDFQDNLDNNNYNQVVGSNNNNNNVSNNNINSTIKRRSKSAHSGRAMTPNLSNLDQQQQQQHQHQQFDDSRYQPHAPKITQKSLNYHSNEYQRSRLQFLQQQPQQQQPQQTHRPTPCLVNPPQYTFVNTGMHTNVIVRPTPRPPTATFSRFTLQTTSLPKPEYPVPIRLSSSQATTPAAASSASGAATAPMDQKTAKQMANNNRKGFQGSREISADSGIASLDTTLAENPPAPGSPRRNRSRPRNLQMVMSGRHKFEVRDLEDPLSSESAVEPLALPKLPSVFSSDNQTVPLSGLVRSNTVLNREAFFRSTGSTDEADSTESGCRKVHKNTSDSEGLEEEKLFLDRSTSEKSAKNHHFKDINTSSKNSSPGSSRASWCNAGESLAIKDCSSLSISSSDESKDNQNEKTEATMPLTEDISPTMISDIPMSTISSITESLPQLDEEKMKKDDDVEDKEEKELEQQNEKEAHSKPERPKSLTNLTESKFAEMAAAAASEFLLDDETSPTDSLVSSTESEDVACKRQKKKANEEIQEKDIDEISPELDLCSPLSPGTPTHASHSLSLSDCGRDFLIDDEIADQPALLFNESADGPDAGARMGHSHTDTPTLMETGSMRSLKSQSKARSALQAAIELSLRTPVSLRKVVLNRAESLDTLSPCDSICSDDLMMDFDVNSSMDSIDKMSASIRSRSGSALHKMDDSQVLSDLDGKSSDMMRELNTILRVHNRNDKDSNVIAHLPARATRLLNRSRLQQCQLSNNGSDSPKSTDSFRRTPSRASSLHHSQRDTNSSSDDLLLHDKSFRNAMIQDVLHFKKQLLRLRRILQETDTLNPFDTNNGQLFASCGLDTKFLEDIDVASLTSSTTDDPLQELADLRRQVVYLQGQVEDRDRTIRLQKNIIDKLESDSGKPPQIISEKECVNSATQTDRTRPLSIGPEGLSRSKPEYTSYTTHFPATTIITTTSASNGSSPTQGMSPTKNPTRRHTVISTTFTNYNQISPSPRRASIAWEQQRPNAATVVYKPVKITLIGDPMSSPSLPDRKCNGSAAITPPKPSPTTPTAVRQTNGDLKMNGSPNRSVDEENRKNLLNGYHTSHQQCNGKENGYEQVELRNHSHQKMHNQHYHHHNHHHQQQQQQHQPQNKQQQQQKQQNLTPTVTIV